MVAALLCPHCRVAGELESYLSYSSAELPSAQATSPHTRPPMSEAAAARQQPGGGGGAEKRKMEGGEAEQGAGPPYTSKVARLDRGPGHPTSLKQEVKPEPETVDSKQWFKQEFVKEEVGGAGGGAGYSGHQHGEQLAGGQDTFLLTNSPLPEQQLAPAPAPDQGRDKQKTNTAANIRAALEASGLAGNLTPEDLQTLKSLNQIAKSTGLSLEQKTTEACQMLKNDPNMSRLLLKLRTGKSVGPKGSQEGGWPVSGGGAQYPGPAQQFPCGQSGRHKLSGKLEAKF